MGVGAGLYMCDVVVKSSRSLSHLLMSSCTRNDGEKVCTCFSASAAKWQESGTGGVRRHTHGIPVSTARSWQMVTCSKHDSRHSSTSSRTIHQRL